jgi:hypothetical protein
MNPIAIELLQIIVEMLQYQQQEIAALKQEEGRETADDAALTPRLNELLARLQMQLPAPPTLPEMPADM